MKKNFKHTYFLIATMLCLAPCSICSGEWISVFDQSFRPGDGEAEMWRKGWIFQDDNFDENPDCENGVLDCTGVRDFVNMDGLGSWVLRLRAIEKNATWIPRRFAYTAIPLPEVPLGSIATVFIRFAVEGFGQHAMGIGIEAEETGYMYANFASFFSIKTGSNDLQIYSKDTYQSYEGQSMETSLRTQTWYQVWLLINNHSSANGGGYFDVYIQELFATSGRPFARQTRLLNPMTANGSWLFRDGLANDQTLNKFMIINSNLFAASSIPDEELYIGGLYIYPDEWGLDEPDCYDCTYQWPSPYWGSYPVQANGWVDTSGGDNFMGWLNVQHEPWVYSTSLGWVYLPETSVTPQGAWAYVLR